MALRFAVSLYVSLAGAALFLAMDHSLFHWFVIPVILCGTLIGADAVDWVRGRLSLFDPVGILGALGYYFLFLSPLLVVLWNHQMLYLPDQPQDYRPWLGGMAILNFAGLLLYRWSRALVFAGSEKPVISRWELNSRRFGILFLVLIAISAGLQAWVYFIYGGLSGYIAAYTAWVAGQDAFKGTGWLFSISESFPILAMMGLAVMLKTARFRRTWTLLFVLMSAFFFMQLLFGGLRGSRANTIWALFWAAGILHFFVRKLPVRAALLGLPFLVVFMYLYGFYKEAGPNVVSLLRSPDERSFLIERTQRTWETILLSDFSRSDVQAFLLYRLVTTPEAYHYAWGQTYVGALALAIPQSVWPERPPAKVKWTTEAEYGADSYGVGRMISSRVYGLAGEAMLNFGPLAAPLSFLFLGVIVGVVRKLLISTKAFDTRLLLMPFLVNFCFLVLLNDADVNFFYLVKFGSLPLFLIWFGSDHQQTSASQNPAEEAAYAWS